MKKIIVLYMLLYCNLLLHAQAPKGFNYQAIARDNSGQLMANKSISLLIAIQNDQSGSVTYYKESFSAIATNQFGLFTLTIGSGTVQSGQFDAIPWATGEAWMSVEMDPDGGSAFVPMGVSRLLSVPYALYAEKANYKAGAGIKISGDTIINTLSGDDWGSQTVQHNLTLEGNGTSANPMGLAQQGASAGDVLKWNGSAWLPGADSSGTGTVTSVQTGSGLSGGPITGTGTIILDAITDASLAGNGTSSTPLKLARQGASTGQVLKWNGSVWVPGSDSSNGGTVTSIATGSGLSGGPITGTGTILLDAKTDTSLTGNGTAATPLKLGRQSATTGQVLKWNGASWAPAKDSSITYTAGTGIVITGTQIKADTTFNWRTKGNTGINNNNFIGTLDSASLLFRINNEKSGILDMKENNTAFGYLALSKTTSANNTAIGAHALRHNTYGEQNVAVGTGALYTQSFTNDNHAYNADNVAVGYGALYSNQPDFAGDDPFSGIGVSNTAVGTLSLYMNTTGYANTALGGYAMYNNIYGYENTAIGMNALSLNDYGYNNVANGVNALFANTSGSYNTAIGNSSLTENSSGSSNTAVGDYSLAYNTTGDDNTAIGTGALAYNTRGSNNTAIGRWADVWYDSLFNATAIGYNATVSASNSLVLGWNAKVGIGTSAPAYPLDVTGAARLTGNLLVKNDKGIIRNSSATQLKMVSTGVPVVKTIAAGGTETINITWSESFTSAPRAYIGDMYGGNGGWAEVVLSVFSTNASGAVLYIFNPRGFTVNVNFNVNVISIGAE